MGSVKQRMEADIPFHPSDENNVASTLHVVHSEILALFHKTDGMRAKMRPMGRILSQVHPVRPGLGLRVSALEG